MYMYFSYDLPIEIKLHQVSFLVPTYFADIIAQEITYEHDNFLNFNSHMDRIKKEKRIESPMKTLLKALQVCSPNSLIFVFTIAHPEDSSLLPDILELIETKRIEVCNI